MTQEQGTERVGDRSEAEYTPPHASEWAGEPGTQQWCDVLDAAGNVIVILRGTWKEWGGGAYIDFGPDVLLRASSINPHRGFDG